MDKTDRHTVKSFKDILSKLPDGAYVAIDNHGECRFLKKEDVDVEKGEYICMDEGECDDEENDPDVDESLFPCIVRITTFA